MTSFNINILIQKNIKSLLLKPCPIYSADALASASWR